jgi:hypothetical protein
MDIHLYKIETCLILYKNQLEMDQISKCKIWNYCRKS